jgi:carbon-monoxide dehydrogenase large subunit
MLSNSRTDQNPSEIGSARRPPEFARLVRGEGRYVSDLHEPAMLYAAFVRSPYAHARIRRLDLDRAREAAGVAAILTAADLPAPAAKSDASGQSASRIVARPLLADRLVRAVGDPIAVVLAETQAQAIDAIELVQIDYEPLPVVTELEAAVAPGAPLVHSEIGTNVAFTLHRGEGDVEAAFVRADHVVSVTLTIPRLTGMPLEPLGAVARWDVSPGQLTVWCTTQAPWRVHATLVSALGLPESSVRVVAPDVGGGFGVRATVYGEYIVTALAARQLGRTVRWIATRQEDFLVTQSSREAVAHASLAVTADGTFLGLRAKVLANLGAYAASYAFATSYGPAQRIASLLTGAYAIPAAAVEVSGIYTNTNPTGAYRGAGRPEAAYIIERLVEEAAQVLQIDSLSLRQRNFVRPEAFPYRNALGVTYDSGRYAVALDQALVLAGWNDLRRQQQALRITGSRELLGIGIACYVELTGGGWESGRVKVEHDGRVIATTGSVSQGQGHATTFAQIVADRLRVRFEDIEVRQGDTADGLPGVGSFASRSTALGGGALAQVSDEILRRGQRIAAHLLEVAPEDIVARDGRFSVVGVSAGERSVTWREVATAAASGKLPADIAEDLDARTQFEMPGEAYAFGACAAVVTVDRDTGVVRLRRLIHVYDVGTVINPRLVEAQLQGGLAQGAGEALGEWLRYGEDGQLLTGSLLDYWLPRADELPFFELGQTVTPTPLNALGAKGVGEAGTIAAPPAIAHAVLDALRPLGVRHLDMPFTPERIWRAMGEANLTAPSAPMPISDVRESDSAHGKPPGEIDTSETRS